MGQVGNFRLGVTAATVLALVMPLPAGDRFPFGRKKSDLEKAAERLDALEEEFRDEGTVVIKAPDVWGESRLTKHRQEFERIMEAKVDDFQLLLNSCSTPAQRLDPP